MSSVANRPVSPAESISGPYKFLDYYVEDDQPRFSGRDRDVREVVERLMTDRACVLYGRSGLGKTSLMLAGVFPELRARGFVPVHARVLESPLPDACKAVADALKLQLYVCGDNLLLAVKRLPSPPRVVLALDQFEEFFIRFNKRPEERRAFSSWLAVMTSSKEVDFRVLISLREEYLSRLDEFTSDLPEMFGSEYRLRPLTAFGARQAITRPLIQAGVEYDQKLVNKVVDMLAVEDFDSLLLQIVCSAIYREAHERSGSQVHLKERDLQNVGGLEGILRRYLDDVTAKISPNHILLCRNILDALITSEGTKRAVTLQTLLQADFTATREEVEILLESLERSRLVRGEMRGGQMWYELTHERLVRHIIDWFKLDRTFADFRAARELIASACRGDRGERFRERLDTLLARGHIEGVIRPFRERLRLEPLQVEFVFWSAVYHMVSDVAFWANVWGYDNSRKALIDLAGRPDETARKAAMVAIPAIPGPKEDLVPICFKLVIQDTSNEVRRAAGAALAQIAEATDIAKLVKTTGNSTTRHAVREALADIAETGRPLDGVPFLARRSAQKIVKRRRYRLHAETIRERGKTGAITGLWAGGIWVCTVGFLVTLGLSWVSGGIPIFGALPSSAILQVWAFGSLAALAVAVFAGWKGCKRAARRIALAGQDSQFYSLGLKRTVSWILLFLVGVAGIVLLEGKQHLEFYRNLSIVSGILALLILAVAAQIALTRRSFWPSVPPKEVVLWALLQSLGLPLLLSGVAAMLLSRSSRVATWILDPDRFGIWFFGSVFAVLLSILTFVLIVALSQAAARHPIGRVPAVEQKPRSRARWIVVLSAIGFFTWFGLSFLPASAPFLAPVISSTSSSGSPNLIPKTAKEIQTTWPNNRFVLFRVEEPHGQWYRVSKAPPAAELLLAKGKISLSTRNESQTQKLLLFVPTTPDKGMLTALSVPMPVTNAEDKNFKLELVPAYDPSLVLNLSGGEQFRQVTFQQANPNEEVWSAELSGHLDPGLDTKGKAIRMSVLRLLESQEREYAAAKMSAQFVKKQACSVSSITSFDLPRSLSTLDFYPEAQQPNNSLPNPYYSSAGQKFLEVPLDNDNSFHVHLELSPIAHTTFEKTDKPGVGAKLSPPEKSQPKAGESSAKTLAVGVAFELANFQDTQRQTIALIDQKKFKDAIITARQTVRQFPEDDCSENNLAWALLNDGQFQEALKHATRAVELNPLSAEDQDTLAHAAYGAHSWAQAEAAWDRAVELDPTFLSHPTGLCKNDRSLLANAKQHTKPATPPPR